MTEAKETKSKLLVKDHDVVVPGEVLAEGMEYLPSNGTYRRDDKIYANQTGLLKVEGKVLKSILLAGAYMPKQNDVIIGRVIDILMSGWRLDTNSAYSGVLQLKDATFDYIKKGADLTAYFNIEEYMLCRIVQVTSQKLIDVSMKGPGLRKLQGGRIIKINAQKVPRIIGKRGSMVSMIKDASGCQVTVGQNGLIWLSGEGEGEVLAMETIKKIEREAHVAGLTDRIKKFLEKKSGKKLEIRMSEEEPAQRSHGSDRGERRYPPRGDRRDQGNRRPPRFSGQGQRR